METHNGSGSLLEDQIIHRQHAFKGNMQHRNYMSSIPLSLTFQNCLKEAVFSLGPDAL